MFDQAVYPETETDPFTIEGFIGWAREQDPKRGYCWMGHCLWKMYGEAMGLGEWAKAYNKGRGRFKAAGVYDGSGEPFSGLAVKFPHTIGAALTRAEAYLEGAGR